MNNDNMNEEEVIRTAIGKYADTVRRICYIYLRNYADVEDVFQDVFIKYMNHLSKFENEEHEKAWICLVTFNRCKDFARSFWKRNVDITNSLEIPLSNSHDLELLEKVLMLSHKEKQLVYMHYYEDYSISELSHLLKENENTLYTRLRRARSKLRQMIEEEQKCKN